MHKKTYVLLILFALNFILLIHCGLVPSEPALPERILWYEEPASFFEQALPLGNGRIGAMVYGAVPSEHILLNEETLWAGGPVNPRMNPDSVTFLPAVRQALFKGDYPAADKLIRNMQGKFSESYLPLGDLFIDLDHGPEVEDYSRDLDPKRALATTEYRIGSTVFKREMFVSSPDQMLFIRLFASKPKALNFSLRCSSQLNYNISTNKNHQLFLDGRGPIHAEPNYRGDRPDAIIYNKNPNGKGMKFRALVTVLETDGSLGHSDSEVFVQEAKEALIAVAIATSFNGFDKEPGTEGKDPKRLTDIHLQKVKNRSYEELKNAHIRDFRYFFDRVTLSLSEKSRSEFSTDRRLKEYREGQPDPDLESLYFQFGRYLLISSSRPGGIPANLQGIWNPFLRPPWSSNYTTNINVEMNYWPAEICNLSEMHEPLLQFIGRLAETGTVTAETFFGCRGWCCNHNSDIWAMTNPVGDFGQGHPVWANWPMAGAWFSFHLWDHYDFSRDVEWLRNYAYPLMKGAALFCLDWLVEGPDGYLVTAPATSPENLYKTPGGYRGAVSIGTTSDLVLIKGLLNKVLKAGDILNRDPDFQKDIQACLNRLYPYQIGKNGNLQEWYFDWEDVDPRHRHMSHLIGLYPDNQISPLTYPDLAEAVRRSLELRGDGGTGWSKGRICGLRARGGYTVDQEWMDGKLLKATIYPDFSGHVKIRYKDKIKILELKSGRAYKIKF